MSGLIDAVDKALLDASKSGAYGLAFPRAAILAVADWLDQSGTIRSRSAARLRAEVAPPPTAEDVIREAHREWQSKAFHTDTPTPAFSVALASALRDAGLLREDA